MITGAAAATINRLPVLLLPGDIFARRNVAPVLQQFESEHSQDISVNDAFKPVSRYWDRINRPDQIPVALLEAMRVLTSPGRDRRGDAGAAAGRAGRGVGLPGRAVREARLAHPARSAPSRADADAGRASGSARPDAPLIVAGGGVIYSEATEALAQLRRAAPASRSARRRPAKDRCASTIRRIWARSAPRARRARTSLAREADLVIGIGTR